MTSLFEAANNFLSKHPGPHRDFVDRVLQAGNIELQILPQPLGRIDEATGGREYDGHKVFALRHPRDSSTDSPDWRERQMPYPLHLADRIGSTGHGEAGSLWVGFDVDTIANHAPGVGVSDDVRKRIQAAIEPLDYVEVRRSSGGEGLHIYVFLEGFETKNHTEHAALARAVLGQVCHDAQLDFAASVDACGGNVWFWRHDPKPDSFRLLKAATRKLIPDDVPNCRDHVDVVSRKRTRVHVAGLDADEAASYPAVNRDAEHEQILDNYRRQGFVLEYLPDFKCYRAHTVGLLKTFKALHLAGAFETVSEGDDPGSPNCFVFLRQNGAMFIVRYGNDVAEHVLWDKTSKGRTCILYNVAVRPEVICRAVGAISIGPGKFTCPTFEQAKRAAAYLKIDLPELSERPISFTFKGENLLVEADRHGKEIATGWGPASRKLKRHFQIDQPPDDSNYDHLIRHLETSGREDAGWLINRDDGTWGRESKDNCKDRLAAKFGIKRDKTSGIMGICVGRPWTLVVEPLQPEFLPGRRWNPNAKRLIVPTQSGKLSHSKYDSILNHCGEDLNEPVSRDPWCQRYGVRTGADYLRLWAASMVRRPKVPLPYLFFWSLKNATGKSAFHRSLAKLFQGEDGATDVYLALTEKFNGQMAGCVLGYIEDKGLNAEGYERLKGWIDSPKISIRQMQTNAYMVDNYAHLVHTANRLDACPLQENDLRVVVAEVSPLERDIPWTEELSPALDKEAPDFLATLLTTPLPPAGDRLYLPVIETPSKRLLMKTETPEGQRAIVVEALVEAIVKLVKKQEHWQGHAGDLLATIGSGPWSNNAGTMAQYLLDTVDPLFDQDITVSIASAKVRGQREINVGPTWLVEPESSAEEKYEDDLRTSQLA
jgi:uncharacterized protein DUF5906